MSSPAAAFLRACVVAGAFGLVLLFFVVAPVSSRSLRESVPVPVKSNSFSVARPLPTETSGPRTRQAVELHMGPSPDYVVIGTLPRGAHLEVVGRSEDGTWLAVRVAPTTKLYAWIPTASVLEAPNTQALPAAPIVLLP
jgi:hypothetical protein